MAIRTLTEIENIFPDNAPRAIWQKATYYNALKDKKHAMAEAHRLLKLFPKASEVPAAHAMLVAYGELNFGGKLTAKATLAIWRNRMTQEHFIGEYSYQVKFPSPDMFRGKPRELADQFYLGVQSEAAEWIQPGTTKTAMIYRMGKTPVANRE